MVSCYLNCCSLLFLVGFRHLGFGILDFLGGKSCQLSAQMLDADDLGQGLSYQLFAIHIFFGLAGSTIATMSAPCRQRSPYQESNRSCWCTPQKKLTYPLKDDGWKTIVLLKWSLFRVNIPLAFQRGNLGASPQQLAWLQDLQLCATCPVFFAARTCVVGYQNGYKDG